jgi:hypothetical protein
MKTTDSIKKGREEERAPSCNWSSTSKVSKFISFAYPSKTLHPRLHSPPNRETRLSGMLGGVSRNFLFFFRGKLSTFNFQLSFPSFRVLRKYRTARKIGRWRKRDVKFDGSSASILNVESSVGQLRCATLRWCAPHSSSHPTIPLIGPWKIRHLPDFLSRLHHRRHLGCWRR